MREGTDMRQARVLVDELTFAEGLRWHDGRVWVSDMYNKRILSALEDGTDLRVEALVDAVPVGLGWLPDGRLLVVAQDRFQIWRRETDGAFVVHADLSTHTTSLPNDLLVLEDGTAYTGCFGFDLYNDEPYQPAPLLRISPDGDITVVGEPAHFPNGMALVGRTAVVAESFGNRLSQYDIEADGSLTNRRDWATFGPVPTATVLADRFRELVVAGDGISGPDRDGALWVASFIHQHAIRVMPGGEVVDTVSTAPLSCFSVALGGHDGRSLFLCATPDELDPEIRRLDPKSTVMIARVEVPLASVG
jgi:sugar lactone lactonase YvrE